MSFTPRSPSPGVPRRPRRASRSSAGGPRRGGAGGGGGRLLVVVLVAAGAVWWVMRRPVVAPVAPVAARVEAVEPVPAVPAEGVGGGLVMEVPDRLPGGPGDGAAGRAGEPGPVPARRDVAGEASGRRAGGGELEADPSAAAAVEFPDRLDLRPVTAVSAEAVGGRERWRRLAFEHRAWSGYGAMLAGSLAGVAQERLPAAPREDEVAALLGQPVFHEVLVSQALLGVMADQAALPLLADAGRRPFFEKLLSDPGLGESLLLSLTPQDRAGEVLGTWADLWLAHEEARSTYAALALACALVFEKPKTVSWNGESLQLTAAERFAWFSKQDAAGRLAGNVRRLPASDLVWVVGAPVPESELEWALRHVKLKPASWGQAYTMIKYDMERALEKRGPAYETYSFAEILKNGGVCADQAYFSGNTARAHGIPAAVVVGDGARGPHAWLRWMDRDGTWRMVGRFDGYGLGESTHAQSGVTLSEEWFVRRSEAPASEGPAARQSHQRLWLGRVLEVAGDAGRAGVLYELAAAANRSLPVVAEARLRHWLAYRSAAPVDEWKSLVSEVKRDFRNEAGVMVLVQRAEAEMIFPRQDKRAVVADLRRDVRQMEKQAGGAGAAPKDEDLAAVYGRQAEVMMAAGDLDGVRSLYRRALNDRGNAATFKVLARDYFRQVSGTPEAALRACRDLETAWKRHVDTGGDFFDLESQASALQVVIDSYREAGDTSRAVRLERELEDRLKRAQRGPR